MSTGFMFGRKLLIIRPRRLPSVIRFAAFG